MKNSRQQYNSVMQKRKIPAILFLFIFLLASCSPAQQATAEPPQFVTPLAASTSPACVNFTSVPAPGPETPSLFPPITSADHIIGPQNAIVNIIVYGDLQNTTSGLFSGVMNRLLEENPNDIRFVSRIFPLDTGSLRSHPAMKMPKSRTTAMNIKGDFMVTSLKGGG